MFISFYFFLLNVFGYVRANRGYKQLRPCLVSLALSVPLLPLLRFSQEFRMWSTQYFTSLLNDRQHFLFTVSLSDSAQTLSLSFNFDQIQLVTQYTFDPVLANLYFYTSRELNTYINFFFVQCRPTDPVFWHFLKKQEKETTRFIFFWTQINSFNLKNQHYNIISRHKTFGGVSSLLFTLFGPFYEIDHHIFCHIEFVSIW